jgi:chromosome segregation ATPase
MDPRHLACLAMALILALPANAGGGTYYRYTNELGNTVVDDNVPPEHVKSGYEVLNEKGVVIKVVPRELSPEEQEVADAQKRLEEQALAEQQRLKEWDESLLMRYSTIEDIEAAQERALRDLKIRVSILKGNKRSYKQQVENYQAQAAEMERMGHEVDVERLQAIEDLQEQIAATDRAITEREREIAAVNAAYDADIERFSMLLELVEFRRQRSLGDNAGYADPRR